MGPVSSSTPLLLPDSPYSPTQTLPPRQEARSSRPQATLPPSSTRPPPRLLHATTFPPPSPSLQPSDRPSPRHLGSPPRLLPPSPTQSNTPSPWPPTSTACPFSTSWTNICCKSQMD